MAHKLQGAPNIDQIPIQLATTSSGQANRPFPQYSGVTRYDAPLYNSNYQALILRAEKRYANGFSLLANFSWSKMLDNMTTADWYNRKPDKGVSSSNRAKRSVISWTYELPAGKGRRFASSGPLSYVIGGWNIGGINTVQSGQPLTPTANPNLCFCFSAGSDRADRIGNPDGPHKLNNWFNLAAFQHPGPLRFGNSAPGVIIGPRWWTLDMNVSKDFTLFKERPEKLNFRADIFNSLNHPNFDNPITSIFPAGAPGTTNVITSAEDPRLIQLSLRFIF
jgi:hypothetical protein